MSSASSSIPSTPDAAALAKMQALYDDGKYIQAYETSKSFGPLQSWTGAAARVFAGRMAYNLGSRKMGRVMHRLAMREHPGDYEVQYFYWLSTWPRRGPLATLEAIEGLGEFEEAPAIIRADWFALRGDLYSLMRDFEKADHWLKRALELQPDRAWLHVLKTENLKNQDRIDEAIECAEHALELRPWYRPALQNLANRYVQANRDEEALELLERGIERIESGDVRIQLAALYLELEQHNKAGELYDSLDHYFPLLKFAKTRRKWISAMRADVAYYNGDFPNAAKLAREADEELFKDFADRLEDDSIAAKRVRLPVKFVRQNHVTCAPATLTSIAQYWKMPADHLDVVEKICYDGTPAHSERRWAEEHGFTTREFRVTWDSACALLDQGIPFTLTTVEPGSAHLQAVFGYDVHRKSFFIRDPGERHYAESFADKMLKHYASSGPRGMAMVPKNQSSLFDGIDLPDADIYDLYHQLEVHFDGHDRNAAVAVLDKMRGIDADHRLTLRGDGILARYDNDISAQLKAYEGLLKQFPEDVNLQLAKLQCLSELGRRDERIEMLKSTLKQDDCDPMFWTRLAAELSQDAREQKHVESLYRKAIRYRPHDAAAVSGLAGIYMDRGHDLKATDLFRIAACLDDKNENRAKSYFHASRSINDIPTAIRFLIDRVQRFGNKSAYPARTLCWAYDNMEKTTEAMEVIKTALPKHQDDGEFMLYSAEFYGRYGEFDKTQELLDAAEGKCHPMIWRRGAALIATYRGETQQALGHWQAIVDQDPLDHHAQSFVTDLIADSQGPDAAIAHLRQCTLRFPNSYSTRLALIEWMRDATDENRKHELDEFLKYHPNDAWALRERAMVNSGLREYDAALADANQALEIEPTHPAAMFIKGNVAEYTGDARAAKEHYRKCLEISVDYDFAMTSLVNACNSKVERIEVLNFIYAQLVKQISLGEGWLTFSKFAQSCLEPEELLSMLTKAVEDRPDLWHAWSALARHLSDMQRHDQAIKVATENTNRFPLLPRVWMDLSAANAACGKIDAEIEALRRAKEINPTWGVPIRLLSEALEKKGDIEGARHEIEQVIRVEPRDVRNLGFLANLMWTQDAKAEALEQVAKAVRMEPGYDWGWSVLRNWCQQLGKPDFDVEVAKELVADRPNEARSWLILSKCLDQDHQVEDSLKAIEKAIELNPTSSEAYSIKAVNLCSLGEYDAAIAAATSDVFGNELPIDLQARVAWIEADRGDYKMAVAHMEKVVEIDPDFVWAWSKLADWYEYLELPEKHFEACQHLIRIEPQNAVSWGYIADIELQRGNRQEAKKYFTQAVQISPAYTYGSGKLIDLLLEDKEFNKASEVIDIIAPHIPPEWVLSEKGRIAALQKDQATAFEHLKKLCVTPAEGVEAIDDCAEHLYKANWGEQVLPIISEALDNPNAQPGVAYVFVNLSATLKKWGVCEERLEGIESNQKLWNAGIGKLVTEYAKAGEMNRLGKLISKYQTELRGSTELWQDVGAAYSNAGKDRETVSWMSDWEQRKDVQPLGLLPLANSLWDLKQDHQANDVSRHAVSVCESDTASSLHMLLCSKYEMLYGSMETSASLIREIDPMHLPVLFRYDWELVIAMLLSLSDNESYSQLAARLKAIWKQLDDPLKEFETVQRVQGQFNWKAAAYHERFFRKLWFARHMSKK